MISPPSEQEPLDTSPTHRSDTRDFESLASEADPWPEVNAILHREFGVALNQAQADELARAIARERIGEGRGVAFVLVNALQLLSREEMEDLARKNAGKCGGQFVRPLGNAELEARD